MKRRVRGKSESTNEIDVLVGQRLRELRMLAGLSQGDLAATIGLTFQQLQKYERGVNRISASKLYLLSQFLNVPVTALFTDVDGQKAACVLGPDATESKEGEPTDPLMRSREGLVLTRHYMRIRDAHTRAAIKAFAEACAGLPATDTTATESQATQRRSDGDTDNEDSSGNARRSRRPRGAIWHPTDIARR